jgi:Halocarboxylic acid dehydrogenase DehI
MAWKKGNRLHLVPEPVACGNVAQVFCEVKAALGITYVPICFQAFAACPKFLELQWTSIKPLLATREFFDAAARLRAESYTHVHNYFKVPRLGEGLAASQAAPVIDLLCYVDPALLLLLSVQLQAFEGVVGVAGNPHPADRTVYNLSPEFTDPDNAPAPIRRILEDMRHTLELPFSGNEQLAISRWPELLIPYWQALKPVLRSALHEQSLFLLRESAWKWAQQIPVRVDMEYSYLLESGVSAGDVSSMTRLTEVLTRAMAASLINITFAKIGIEGGNTLEFSTTKPDHEKVA